jgi:hypothetical protein
MKETCQTFVSWFFFLIESSTPRTPSLLKRTMTTVQHDASDTASVQSAHRQTPKRTMTMDSPDIGDSM